MSTTEERQILEGILNGDEKILKAFYRDNMPYIKKYILKNAGNHEDVEDVFQDAMVFIYQKMKTDSIHLESSLRTYFYGVCKNIWRNRLRRNKKMVITNDLIDEKEHTENSIVDEIINKEQEYLYRKHFSKLGTTCQQLLTLLFKGKSMREISKVIGYSEGYTRKKKFGCKQHLIEMIEQDPAYQELKLPAKKN